MLQYLDKLLLKSRDLCWAEHPNCLLLLVVCRFVWLLLLLLLLRGGSWLGAWSRAVCWFACYCVCWFACYCDGGTDLFVVSTSCWPTPPRLVGDDGGGLGGRGLEEHRHDVVHRAHDVLLVWLVLSYWQNKLLLIVKTDFHNSCREKTLSLFTSRSLRTLDSWEKELIMHLFESTKLYISLLLTLTELSSHLRAKAVKTLKTQTQQKTIFETQKTLKESATYFPKTRPYFPRGCGCAPAWQWNKCYVAFVDTNTHLALCICGGWVEQGVCLLHWVHGDVKSSCWS